ncbi:hypothetical protein U1872_05105 [Sphingomonas sp. RB3P16]|uniref:hypothetical protein n=1 Tax=Parasphingomonas frigoris TaxID=3096163 RepID=UPI002FC6CE5B
MSMRARRVAAALLAVVAPSATVAQEAGLDSFIGTLAVEQGDVILTRCDIGNARYLLRDAAGAEAVARYRQDGTPAYAEVIARYSEEGSRNVLTVTDLADLTPGKSCHLLDALDALSQPDAPKLKDAPANRRIAGSTTTQGVLVGHYYLVGVMETGSELLLRPDGLFAWSLSYGAVDQDAQGAWHVERDEVVLVPSAPSLRRPLFSYLSTGPWTAEAEQERRERERGAIVAAIRARCPIFPAPEVMATPAEIGVPALPVRRARAATALRAAIAARSTVETLAARVMAEPATPGTERPGTERVRQAISDWLNTREAALQAANAAGLPNPALADPILPALCTMPPDAPVGKSPAAPPPGLGVQVLDPESETPARGIAVALKFADGTEQQLVTDRNGLALVSGKAAANAVGATIQAKTKTSAVTVSFAPVRSGIIRFGMDMRQLAARPFDTLRLHIVGGGLVPDTFANGRYERRP